MTIEKILNGFLIFLLVLRGILSLILLVALIMFMVMIAKDEYQNSREPIPVVSKNKLQFIMSTGSDSITIRPNIVVTP